MYRTSKPMYNEELFVHNFPAEGAVIDFIVWDRNFAVQHEYIASGALTLDLSQTQVSKSMSGTSIQSVTDCMGACINSKHFGCGHAGSAFCYEDVQGACMHGLLW